MVNSTELQVSYNHLYTEMRNYIWSVDTVIALAELEEEVYSAFPNATKLNIKFNEVLGATFEARNKDKELNSAFVEFKNLLTTCDSWYVKLPNISAS